MIGGNTRVTIRSVSESKHMKTMNRLYLALVAFAAMLLAQTSNAADATSLPDPSTIVTSASTAVYNVGTLIAAVVGFFIVIRVVKWIRK